MVRQSTSMTFFFSSRRRHTRFDCDWSSDVCSSDLRGGKDIASVSYTAAPDKTVKQPLDVLALGNSLGTGKNGVQAPVILIDRKSTRLNSSHSQISYAVFCLKKKKKTTIIYTPHAAT